MKQPIITLTTDFGEASPYVGAMKGVILGINPTVKLVDLSHDIPPQNIQHAAFFLAAALPYFPKDTVHVVVVDPGVGTDRALLYGEVGGQRLLVPDNGCWTHFALNSGEAPRVFRLTERRFWRPEISPTFHGRDILAPVAGHVSLGVEPAALGPRIDHWVSLEIKQPLREGSSWRGEVVFIDRFGNLITNIPGEALVPLGKTWSARVGNAVIKECVLSYGGAPPGSLVTLVSSAGLLEIAVNQGSAAAQLGARVGTPVRVMIED